MSGGAQPGARGSRLVAEVMAAIGALDGVVVHRNPVMRVRLPSGGFSWTGVGGEGAPDLLAEVQGPDGWFRALWFECKQGDGARVTPAQRRWHAAAAALGRHVFVVRCVEDAVAAVARAKGGGR